MEGISFFPSWTVIEKAWSGSLKSGSLHYVCAYVMRRNADVWKTRPFLHFQVCNLKSFWCCGWEVVFECLPGPGALDWLSWCFMPKQMRETPLKPVMFHQDNVRGGNEATSSRCIVAQMSEVSQHPMGLNWGVWLKRRPVDKCHPSHWQKCIWQRG